jgi:hypothetical protein
MQVSEVLHKGDAHMATFRNSWKSSSRRSAGRRTSSYGRTGSWNRMGYGSTGSSYGWYNTTRSTGTGYTPSAFQHQKLEIVQRIGSYRNISQQITGSAKITSFSPTLANRWIRYVNDGARVYKFANKDFCRYFGSQWQQNTPNAAQRYLQKRFGTGVKAVCRGKGGTWLIAATPSVTGSPFRNYNWK